MGNHTGSIILFLLLSTTIVSGIGLLFFGQNFSESGGPIPASPVSCETMKRAIDRRLEEAQVCEKDEDCIMSERYYCPFGCYQIYNKNYPIETIDREVTNFQTRGCMECEYTCMRPPEPKDIVCRENRCTDIRSIR